MFQFTSIDGTESIKEREISALDRSEGREGYVCWITHDCVVIHSRPWDMSARMFFRNAS